MVKKYCIIATPIIHSLSLIRDLVGEAHVIAYGYNSEEEAVALLKDVFEEYEQENYLLSVSSYYTKL